MMMKKRGLSDVVTVTLIILLAVAAVVIVWAFVRSTIEEAGKDIKADCIKLDLRPVSCTALTGVVSVLNTGGDVTANSVRLIYYDADGVSEVEDSDCTDLGPLEQESCAPTAVPGITETKVKVAGIIGTGTDKTACIASASSVDCV